MPTSIHRSEPTWVPSSFLTGAILFSSGNQAFIFTGGFYYGDSLYFSPDGGKKYFELEKEGSLSFKDPHHGRTGRFQRNGYTIELDGVIFTNMECPSEIEVVPLPTVRKPESEIEVVPTPIVQKPESEIEVVPLPTVRKPEYLFRLPNGGFIYVSSDKYDRDPSNDLSYEESFKLYIGNGTDMRQVAIADPIEDSVIRYRNGGTTYIKTVEGVLYSPPFSTFSPTRSAKWKGEVLIQLDPTQFRISETEEGVQISE